MQVPDQNLGSQEIEQRLFVFVRNELLSPETSVGRDEDLLSGELLDSIAVVRLGAFVEEEFHLAIQPADFVIENFRSIAALTAYVHRAVAG